MATRTWKANCAVTRAFGRRSALALILSAAFLCSSGLAGVETSVPVQSTETASDAAAVPPAAQAAYERAFTDLYDTLGRSYPCFALKGIDWKAVGAEMLPRVKSVTNDDDFGLLCMELVAKLQDSHAVLGEGKAKLPAVPFPQWDPGFSCLIDDRGKPVVYYVDKGGPAQTVGLRPGMTVVSLDGRDAAAVMDDIAKQASRYEGYSSDRYMRYHAAQWLGRHMEKGVKVTLAVEDTEGQSRTLELSATMGVRYLPRLPVPVPGISDSANVSWTILPGNVGYIYVRRIQNDLLERLDQAVAQLKNVRGLIIDVRGNSGGGFDAARSFRNFALDDPAEPERPRYRGPIAMLIDSRCISAGEGWASWFVAKRRAELFGEATAGASSRKTTYTLKNGLYKVVIPVKPYPGFLDRPIERRGIEPDVPIRQNAKDLANGRDTVLEAAKAYLLQLDAPPAK